MSIPEFDKLNFNSLVELFARTNTEMQSHAVHTVDTVIVVRNWLFGWYIVEFEQKGADRAKYGSRFLESLSEQLKKTKMKGCSTTRLKLYRSFYQQYKQIRPTMSGESGIPAIEAIIPLIRPTLSDESSTGILGSQNFVKEISAELFKRFSLGWSHYVSLLTLNNSDEQRFYEIEALEGSWSVRELERQIASSLYERLALSRNKGEIRNLAEQGLIIEKPADIIKNPMVLEFLELEEKPSYSENDLESAIIDKL